MTANGRWDLIQRLKGLNAFYSFDHIIKEVKYDERFNLLCTILLLFYDWFPLRWSELLNHANHCKSALLLLFSSAALLHKAFRNF